MTHEETIAAALKRAKDEFGVIFTEVEGPEPGFRLESPKHRNPVFRGATPIQALGLALAEAKKRGLIRD